MRLGKVFSMLCPTVSMDWFCWENRHRKPWWSSHEKRGAVQAFRFLNFPNKTNPLTNVHQVKFPKIQQMPINPTKPIHWLFWSLFFQLISSWIYPASMIYRVSQLRVMAPSWLTKPAMSIFNPWPICHMLHVWNIYLYIYGFLISNIRYNYLYVISVI